MYQQYKQYITNLIDSQDNSNNLKCFFHYIKGKCPDNVGIGALMCQANDMITDYTEKAEILSNQLKEILVEEQYDIDPITHVNPNSSSL